MSLTAGSKLGPYEIIAPIGAGGMGEVYRARDPRLGRDVAIKVLPESVASDPERLGRFEREARAVAALSHPNILSIFDIGEISSAPKSLYAVMELLEGETLRERIAEGPLTPRRAVEIGSQIAHGLAAAHERGLVHRDLKPENVFLTSDGRAKILDFGLARPAAVAAPAEGMTSAATRVGTTPGLVVGTIGYMAPEQVRGDNVDGRTDIFAFGALMYELLTGQRAFKGQTPADTMSAILKEEPAEPKTRDGALPHQLERVILRCLEKLPSRRFQSAHDLAFALEHALGSTSGTTTMPAVTTATDGAAAQPANSRRFGLVTIVGLAMLAGGIGLGRLWRPSAAASLNLSFASLTMDSGVEEWPSLTPDGSSFVYAAGPAGHRDIYLRRIDGRNALNLTGEAAADNTMPALSPDGRRIAFWSSRNGGGVFVMEATGENVKRVSDKGFNPAWSADGTRLAFATEPTITPAARTGQSHLWVADLSSGESHQVGDNDAMQPSWSPDGRHIAVWQVHGGQRRLVIVDVATGKSTSILDDKPSVTFWNPQWSPDGQWMYFVSNATGAMALSRVPIDADGRPTGTPEAIIAPAVSVGQVSVARDGQHLAYQSLSTRCTLSRLPFDPVRGTAGDPAVILAGALCVVGPMVSPDGRSVAFGNQFSLAGLEDIFTIDSDGKHLRQLTNDAARDRGPVWSADGSRLFFYSNRGGPYEIWSMNPDGTDLKKWASIQGDDLLWPRLGGGGEMAVSGIKASALFNVSAGPPARLVEMLPPISAAGDRIWTIAVSPDRSTLAGLAQSDAKGLALDLVLYRMASHQYERLVGMGVPVAWLPDGKRLIVASDRYYVYDLATKARTPIGPWTPPGAFSAFSNTLSPDGRTFYMASSTDDADVWMMTVGQVKK